MFAIDTKYDVSDIYYQDKYEFKKSTLAGMLLFIAVTMLFGKNEVLYSMILEIIRLVIIITLLMFITHSDNINPKPIQKVIRFNLIIMICLFIYNAIPRVNVGMLHAIIPFKMTPIEYGNIYIYILYYILSKYKLNKGNIKKEYKIVILIVVLSTLIDMFVINNIKILILTSVIGEIILIVSMINVFKHKLVINGNINLLKLNILSSLIYVNAIEISICLKLEYLKLVVTGVTFAIFIASLMLIIDNISKNMYSFIFKNIHNINEKLDIINYRILKENKELEKSKLEIEKGKQRYKELLNSIPRAVIIINTINHRIIYYNNEFQELIGFSSIRKIINKKIEDVVNFNFEILEEINVSEVYFGKTKFMKKKDLEIRFSNYNKNKEEITIVFEDITNKVKIEKIKSEIERKKLNDNIKKNFLANVSHDFKIPINVICSAIQLESLLISNNDLEGVKKYNAISKQNCLTLIKLTNNIIDISKINSEYMNPKLIYGDIVSFIEDNVASFIEYAKIREISIIFDTDIEEVYMRYDKEFMERIILNLISNAIKFTPYNGIINVEIINDENYIYISVKDTGVGMNKDFAKEVFDKYSKGVTGNIQGTGVGLYVVYNLVHLQNGEIWVDSEVGQGAKFTMKFCKE